MPKVKSEHNWKIYLVIFGITVTVFIMLILALIRPFMSLNSFKRVDENLYVMTNYSDCFLLPKNPDNMLKIFQHIVNNFTNIALQAVFETEAFAAVAEDGHLLLGRNQVDSNPGPILFLLNKPRKGYTSVAILNLAYLGLNKPGKIGFFRRLPLLLAPTLVFDGMNEHGVAVGITSTGLKGYAVENDRTPINGFYALRLILDQAKNTQEAINLLSIYNVDFFPWPNMHVLIADAEGQSVIVEFLQGEMVVTVNEESFLILSHCLLAQKQDSDETENYTVINNVLDQQAGWLKLEEALALLEGLQSEQHRWSVVYDTKAQAVNLVVGEDYTNIRKFKVGSKKKP